MPHENHHHRRHKRDSNRQPEHVHTEVSIVTITASTTVEGSAPSATLDGGSSADSDSTTTYWISATIDGNVVSWQTTETFGSAPSTAAVATTSASTTDPQSSVAATTSALSVDTSSVVTSPSTTLATSQTSVVIAPSSRITDTAASKTSASSSSSTAGSSGSGSGHLSTGASFGISFVAVAVFCACITALFCVYKKKRAKQDNQQQERRAEKPIDHNGILAAKKIANAPQLSALRPVTQFGANFGGNMGPPTPRPNSPPRNQGARDMSEKQELNPQNPFGAYAAANSNEHNKANPFGNHAATGNGPQPAIVPGAADAITHGGILPEDVPMPLNLSKSTNPSNNSNSSPSGTVTSSSSTGQHPVHRATLRFEPSMDDELGLSEGELVRLVTTYDDGWCFVTCLKRRGQGVCPRSCLSVRPVEPRSPRLQQGRPINPNQGRQMTPTKGPINSQSPISSQGSGTASINTQSPIRPMVPGQARPMTPRSGGQPQPQPPAAMSRAPRPASPAGNHSSSSVSFPDPPSSPSMSTGTNDQSGNRSPSPSVNQNQGGRKTPSGPSRLNPATLSSQSSSVSLNSPVATLAPTTSTEAIHSSSLADESSFSSTTAAPPTPAKHIPPSQIPVPTGAVGRKPVPGQAL